MSLGGLFTQDYLRRGIIEDPDWAAVPATEFDAFRTACRKAFEGLKPASKLNETQTEDDVIYPVLAALDWPRECWIAQSSTEAKGRANVPDLLLFPDAEARAAAKDAKSDAARYKHGIAIAENKAWGVPLDRQPSTKGKRDEVPSTQILRYLNGADVASDGKVLWGMLTNGRHWRLYWQRARARAEDFVEIDLALLMGVPGAEPDLFAPPKDQHEHWLKVFYVLFRRGAFLPDDGGKSFHARALAEGKRWESHVAQNLSELVFGSVFRDLVRGLAAGDPKRPDPAPPAYFDELRNAALILLYRLLFVLYAEDRNLLPVKSRKYDDYALRKLRDDVAKRIDENDTFSDRQSRYYAGVKDLFKAIDKGDPALEVPPYNGGLFDANETPLLERAAVSDAVFAKVLDALSRIESGGRRLSINYRDLSVQQLGSIYERLLEYDVAMRDGSIEVVPNVFARKGSGSYYTPDELVGLIVERAVGPLIDERMGAFKSAAAKLAKDKRPVRERLKELIALDPAMRILELKICDPAMGSGHFLVSLVDYIADRVLVAMAEARAMAVWAEEEEPYLSPLVAALAAIRANIRKQAKEGGWTVEDSQLEDRLLVRRMILKRCVYGVDRNPMAVELAKVSLWLHTFTVGAPLSFLDHHLRCGNSLFGELVRPVEDELAKRGAMYLFEPLRQAKRSAQNMSQIERLTDADLAEVRQSATIFAEIEAVTKPLASFLSFVHAQRWLDRRDDATRQAIDAFYLGGFGDPIRIASGEMTPEAPREKKQETFLELRKPEQTKLLKDKPATGAEMFRAFEKLLADARALIAEERFLHWQVAFPGVWDNWESVEPTGGFDAVIGNPPWDRMKLQEVEWFAARRPEIALSQKASDRKKMIAALEKAGDPLWNDYTRAKERAESAVSVARGCGLYPLLARGDIDLYALFVERSHGLIKQDGIVGLLVPSGISSDLSTSAYFRSISSASRLGTLFDFANKRHDGSNFFSDVYYRFKFSIIVAGGISRTFDAALCGFYLRDIDDILNVDKVFALAAQDFLNVNPNTGTAPVFQSRRDAALTTGLHSQHPVLVARKGKNASTLWPVEYVRMFDMATDSGKFREQLPIERQGFYKITRNRLKKGTEEYWPLYEGKMVQAFDHRAADIVIAAENVFRPGQGEATTQAEYADPDHVPNPRYFVSASDLNWPAELSWVAAFKDVTSVTNARTMIAMALPYCGAGHTLPVLFPSTPERPDDERFVPAWLEEVRACVLRYKQTAPLLLANFNSVPFDYLVRQKVQGNHLTWFILEQTPVLPPDAYARKFGKKTAAELIKSEVLKLTYVSNDMEAFARDMGYEGKPLPWDPDARRHSRARLDALYFHLYGVSEDDAAYMLETFPIVKREDIAETGRFITKDLALGYYRAFAAGDTDSKIAA